MLLTAASTGVATGGLFRGAGFGSAFPEFGFSGITAGGGAPQHQQQHDALVADVFLIIGATLFLSRVARPLWRAPMLAIADRTLASSRSGSDGASSKGLTDLFYSLISSIAKAAVSSGCGDGKDALMVSLANFVYANYFIMKLISFFDPVRLTDLNLERTSVRL